MRYIKKIHLTACGTPLAFASLGNLIGVYSAYYKLICGIFSIFTLALLTIKIIAYKQDFINDIHDINIISVLPTYFMTIMTLSTYGSLAAGGFNISKALWLSAFIAHITLALIFVKNYILKFDINKVLPNWFITCVAYASVGIAAPFYGMRPLGQVFVIIGLVCYFILLPVVMYRLLIVKAIPENLKLSVWLLNSPINICIVAYISSFTPNPTFLLFLLAFSLASFVFSLCKVDLKRVYKNGFTVSFSVFTFPTVIFVTASKEVYKFFYNNGLFNVDLSYLFIFLESVCVILIFGIFVSYTMYSLKKETVRKKTGPLNRQGV